MSIRQNRARCSRLNVVGVWTPDLAIAIHKGLSTVSVVPLDPRIMAVGLVVAIGLWTRRAHRLGGKFF